MNLWDAVLLALVLNACIYINEHVLLNLQFKPVTYSPIVLTNKHQYNALLKWVKHNVHITQVYILHALFRFIEFFTSIYCFFLYLTLVRTRSDAEMEMITYLLHYQKVQQYFLVKDGAGSNWLPIHKIQEQLSEKRSRGG